VRNPVVQSTKVTYGEASGGTVGAAPGVSGSASLVVSQAAMSLSPAFDEALPASMSEEEPEHALHTRHVTAANE
jgi:hypothetical protein